MATPQRNGPARGSAQADLAPAIIAWARPMSSVSSWQLWAPGRYDERDGLGRCADLSLFGGGCGYLLMAKSADCHHSKLMNDPVAVTFNLGGGFGCDAVGQNRRQLFQRH